MGESGIGSRRRIAPVAAGVFCLFAIGLIGGAYVNGLSGTPADSAPRAAQRQPRVAARSPEATTTDALADRLSAISPTAGPKHDATAAPVIKTAAAPPPTAAPQPAAQLAPQPAVADAAPPVEPVAEHPRSSFHHRREASHRHRHEATHRIAAVFPAAGGLYRVQFGSFTTAAQAERIARTIETRRLKIAVTALRDRHGHALYLVRSQMFRSQSDADAAAAAARKAIHAKHLDRRLPVVIRHMTVEEATDQRHEQLAARSR